jgi:nitrogen fixation NifU-like protein
MFSAAVLDHFQNPRNPGELEQPSAVVEVTNPACGDVLRVTVRVAGGKIEAACFRAGGCVTSMACGSLLTEWLCGKTAAELRALRPEELAAALGGLPAATFHAAQLACDAALALSEKLA